MIVFIIDQYCNLNERSGLMNGFFKIKNFQPVIVLTTYFLIAFFILNRILFSSGTVGFFHDWPIGPYPEMNRFYANGGFYVWNSQLGNTVYFTDWIFRLSLVPFSFLDGETLTKGLLTLIITLSGFSAFCLGRRLGLNQYSSFAVGILYIFSPIIFTRIVAGHIYYLIAYFLSPLILTLFLKGKEDKKNKINKYFIIAGILTSVAVIQLQFLVMIFIILLVFSLVDIKNIKISALGLIVVFSITFLIDLSPIVLSQTLVKNTNSYPSFNPVELFSYHEIVSAANLTKSFRLLGYESHSYSYTKIGTPEDPLHNFNAGTMPSWIFYFDFLLPIVGFSALIFRRDKYAISFAAISLIGLFLLKGLNSPFPSVFRFIFIHGFYIFRELWHISFLYGFGISFLTAFFLERLLIIPSKSKSRSHVRPSFYTSFYKVKNYFRVILSSILISLIVISNGYPLLIGNFGGYLQTYNLPKDYHTLYDNLLTNTTYNTLILPLFTPMQYKGSKVSGLDPIILDSANNIFDQYGYYLTSHPLTSVSTWLHSIMQQNKTNNLGNLLSGFGIKYVVLRKDFVSNYPDYVSLGRYQPFLKRWYSPVEPFLDTQKDLVVISNTPHYKIYQNVNNAKKIFVPLTVANGLSDLRDLLYISNFTSLSNVGVYPLNTSTPFYDFVGLGQYAPSFDAREGWTTNRDWFGYNYLLASRVNVGALTISNNDNSALLFDLTVAPKYQNKSIEIWMKAFTWPKGNLVNININGNESSYNLYSTQSGFSLIKIFDGKRNTNAGPNHYHFLIRNIAGSNYIEGIYIKEKDIEQESQDNNILNKVSMVGIQDQTNYVLNPDFSLAKNNQSGSWPLYWNDLLKNCDHIFKCIINSTGESNNNTSDKDNSNNNNKTSFQLSTTSVKPDAWSEIYGNEIDVIPREKYQIITHMKLNQFATRSHVAIEVYNETSNMWHQIGVQCPSGTNGPLEWHQFVCVITIPEDISKIRPVLKAGWSSQPNKQAITSFSNISILNSNVEGRVQKLRQIEDQVAFLSELPQGQIKTTSKLNPTLWNVRIGNASRPFTLNFAESYDPAWEARIYKDGKKVDVVKSTPMYGAINGFQINQTGNLDIVLRYTRQDWYETGLVIAAITFAFCIFYIFYEWRRGKGDKWAEKTGRILALK
jgi:hypothetical protein